MMGILSHVFRRKRDIGFHPQQRPLYDMALNTENLKRIFEGCGDFTVMPVRLGGADGRVTGELCYLDGVVDGQAVGGEVLRPLTEESRFGGVKSARAAAALITSGLAYFYSTRQRETMAQVVDDLVAGWCVLVFDGLAVSFETKTSNQRSIEKPEMEKPLKGSKDAFSEAFRTNTSLLRRKVRSPALKLAETAVGRRTRTKVAVAYIEGLTNPTTVAAVQRRLRRIDIDGLLVTGDLEEYLLDRTSPFPQIVLTERPDRFAMELLSGRVGLLVDGIPFGFLLPATLAEQLKVPEDNAGHSLTVSVLTLLRYMAMLLSVLLPAVYVAVTMYHQEMIPTKLMLSIIQSKQDVPFSTAAEVLGMLVAFELLQEAGLRLPETIGETVSIIGALIVGQSAVEARVISPVVVIVVAVAGITGYTMPNQDLASALRLCRFGMVLVSLALGLFGMVIGGLLLIYYLCTLESLGTAYMAPFCEGGVRDVCAAIIRFPLPSSKYRDRFLHPANVRNQK